MFTNTKRATWFAALFFAAALFLSALSVGIFFSTPRPSYAAESDNVGRTYYYDELKNSPIAQKFYGAMADMAEKGSLKDGKYECDLIAEGILTESEVSSYLDGSAKVPVAFGAARDAFYMDHPDLFYIDVYKLYLSAGMKGDKYVAFIDAGNADNYYLDNAFSTTQEVDAAITAYNAKLDEIVAAAKAVGSDPVKQIEYVNEYIAKNTEYDYGARENAATGNVYAAYVNTAYGSLVKQKAMCGGYARAFKAVLDRLDIPCVLVQGSAYSGKATTVAATGEELEAGYEAHMWNAVEVGGLWYAVDVTYNSGAGGKYNKYLLVGDDYFSINHIEDNVISSSGFELSYPALRPLNYGVNEDKSGFEFKDSGEVEGKTFGYIKVSNSEQYELNLGVAYEGKNARQLEEEGKYLAFRYSTAEGWLPWYGRTAVIKMLSGGDREVEDSFYIGDYTLDRIGYNCDRVQYAIFDYAPDNITIYDPDNFTDDHTIAMSTIYSNSAYMKYIPAPYVKTMSPNEKGNIKSFEPLEVSITYSEKLVYSDDNAPVGIAVTGVHSDLGEYAKATNVVFDGDRTVKFTLAPSKQYAHNCEMYNMVPTNLVGENSGKVPEPANLSFKMKQVVCSKIFNDGRLYMQVFGQPQFVSASDLSMDNFADKNGQPVVGNQRSQLMLVVNETTKAETDEMKEALTDNEELGLTENDIKASSTYQIDLQVCGVVQKVPEGSYMQVGFGFPEGFGPEQAGVTFTVYHYKRDAQGKIIEVDEVPCVVSQYGIIATVKSFSPFMICAVDSSKVASGRKIYSCVEGDGGSIDKTTIVELKAESDTVEYTITPDGGYKLDRVLLNGTDVSNKVSGGKLVLGYADVKENSVLEVSFVSDRVAKRNADGGITINRPKLVVTEKDMIAAVAHVTAKPSPAPDGGSNVGLIVGIVVPIVLVLAGAGIAVFFILRKKKTPASHAPKKRK